MNRKGARHICLAVGLIVITSLFFTSTGYGFDYPDPKAYFPGGMVQTITKHKNWVNDPRPLLETLGPKQVLPKAFYEKLVHNVGEMKKEWSEIVGFKSPDVVGKIAPDIKPGKYTWQDVQKNPGFKQLMWPQLYERIASGAPPFSGNIPEFEIIPTRQYYWSLPISRLTKSNEGKTKLDEKGYLVFGTWQGGYPFPKPSGKFKAQHVLYNMEKRYLGWGGNYILWNHGIGVTRNHAVDYVGGHEVRRARLAGGSGEVGQTGWFDNRAKERNELFTYALCFGYPRNEAGFSYSVVQYMKPEHLDSVLAYIPAMRRIRKLSSTDTQDAVAGMDMIYDDGEGFNQKISPTHYPYKYEILEEREYLVPASSIDGAEYLSEKGWELRNIRFERRPIYVLQMIQQDPNYVYSKRIMFIDKETFLFYHIQNYDRKGRLYRTFDVTYAWHPEMGAFSWSVYNHMRDYVDKHSFTVRSYSLPALWTRRDLSVDSFITSK